MMKRMLSLLLALCLVAGLVPAVFAGQLDNGLEYEIVDDHVEITGYNGSATEVVIPNEIDGLPVTVIGNAAFRWRTTLTSITLPDTLTTINSGAFRGCTALTSITLPDTLTTIGTEAFSNCTALTSIVIPEGVTELLYYTFDECDSLTSISIPASMSNLDVLAFIDCDSLSEILIDSGNEYYCFQDGILYTKDMTALLWCTPTMEGAIVIPEGVTTLTEDSFDACPYVTSISLPASVTTIERSALTGNLYRLREYLVDSANEVFCAVDGVLYTKDMTQLVRCPNNLGGHLVIPETVTSLAWRSFYNCRLTSVVLPSGLPAIDEVFTGCSIKRFEIPVSVTYVEYGCFYNSDRVQDVYYHGTQEQWEAIEFMALNTQLTNANIHFNSTMPDPNPFSDVPKESWYEDPIVWAVDEGITNGLTDTTFGPNEACNRAQVVTFLWRAAGCPEPTTTENPFVDVQAGSFYEKPVMWAVEKGITNGSDATHFNPSGVCNRAQVVTFLYRAFSSPAVENADNPFTDVPAGSFYEAPVLWAVENGVTNGLSATTFGPNESCNRAQVVTFLYRAYN